MKASSRLEYLMHVADMNSEQYRGPSNQHWMEWFFENYKVLAAMLICMDWRVHSAVFDNLSNLVNVYREPGGKFDIGWDGLRDQMRNWRSWGVKQKAQCLLLPSYHFSEVENDHLGCAAFKDKNHICDPEAAMDWTANLTRQTRKVFGETQLYPMMVGLCTSNDALIIHHEREWKNSISMASLLGTDELSLKQVLREYCPSMTEHLVLGTVPFLQANMRRMQKVANRPKEEHTHIEFGIGIGRGLGIFDEVDKPSRLFKFGTYNPDLASNIHLACDLLDRNLKEGRVEASTSSKLVLFVSCSFWQSSDQAGAEASSLYYRDLALKHIPDRHKHLMPLFDVLPVTVDMRTRQVHRVKEW